MHLMFKRTHRVNLACGADFFFNSMSVNWELNGSNFILIVLIKFRAPISLEYYNYNKL